MTAAVRQLLDSFDALSEAEKHKVAVEILRRSAPDGDLPDVALVELADELFRRYDTEEEQRQKAIRAVGLRNAAGRTGEAP